MKTILSKTKLLQFYQCPKLGYLSVKNSKLLPKPDLATQQVFAQGREVGKEAQKHFPNGIEVKTPSYEPQNAFKATMAFIESGANTLYEPAFIFNDVLVRIDILHREDSNSPWQIYEVKSSTSTDTHQVLDLAIQYWILHKLGMKVSNAYLMYINRQCIAPDFNNLFKLEQLSEQCLLLLGEVEQLIVDTKELLEKSEPNHDMGEHCESPYKCPLMDYCRKLHNIPEVSPLEIPRLGKEKWEYVSSGVKSLEQVDLSNLNKNQKNMVVAHLTKKPFLNLSKISSEINNLQYPIFYLDFETEMKAIPSWDGTRPYDQVAFQYSLHIEQENGSTEHFEFLNTEYSDPREKLLESLIPKLGEVGTIVSYNAGFEASRLNEMAKVFPRFAPAIAKIVDRFYDPLTTIRNCVYYPEFKGKFSIKVVAPVLLGETASYKTLAVQDGIMAQIEYSLLIDGEDTEQEKNSRIEALLAYCKQDTWLMVELVRHLRSLN